MRNFLSFTSCTMTGNACYLPILCSGRYRVLRSTIQHGSYKYQIRNLPHPPSQRYSDGDLVFGFSTSTFQHHNVRRFRFLEFWNQLYQQSHAAVGRSEKENSNFVKEICPFMYTTQSPGIKLETLQKGNHSGSTLCRCLVPSSTATMPVYSNNERKWFTTISPSWRVNVSVPRSMEQVWSSFLSISCLLSASFAIVSNNSDDVLDVRVTLPGKWVKF